jgi:hypothetical protein
MMRRWVWVATLGLVLVLIAFIVSALVIVDKERFGSLVGPAFLPAITVNVFVGGALMLLSVLMMPSVRRTWRGITLILWAVIALTSPVFGFLFLLPWGVLVLALTVVIPIFVTLFRLSAAGSPHSYPSSTSA